MPNVFSVPIFFIVFRETLEAVIIISVLLGIVERIANARLARDSPSATETENEKQNIEIGATPPVPSNDDDERKKLLRKLRIQVCQRPPELNVPNFRIKPRLVICALTFSLVPD